MSDKRYLVFIQIDRPTVDRVARVAKGVQESFVALGIQYAENPIRSLQADQFAYVVRTKLNARQIKGALESPGADALAWDTQIAPFLTSKDGIFIIEIGNEFASTSHFGRVQAWLQHH